ncbi:Serine Threonine protein kinase [Klebsormidium nitens]|uniref:Serine Threonine protein kinase n=1 Tax=Klebsormidium nitens TaxID=105231 RepID=A0A1Y1IRU2_KLENI|nr:Serine Threonine protein kinase [Klebsormidium nitens]|eukprot:GAQ91971.1 Serine Threonine protein kinase [Klebsormidium nitens]
MSAAGSARRGPVPDIATRVRNTSEQGPRLTSSASFKQLGRPLRLWTDNEQGSAESSLPGKARLLVVSNIYGVTFFAHANGVYAAPTARLIELAQLGDRESSASNGVGEQFKRVSFEESVHILSLSADELRLAVCTKRNLTIYSTQELLEQPNPTALRTFARRCVRSLAWSPTGPCTLLALLENNILLLIPDVTEGAIPSPEVLIAVAASWSPDGRHVAYVSTDGTIYIKTSDLKAFIATTKLELPVGLRARDYRTNNDIKQRIDSLEWVHPDLLLLGLVQSDPIQASGSGTSPLVALRFTGSDFADRTGSLSQILFTGLCPHILPGATRADTGPNLHTAVISAWNFILVANRKSASEQINLLGWDLPSAENAGYELESLRQLKWGSAPDEWLQWVGSPTLEERDFVVGLAVDITSSQILWEDPRFPSGHRRPSPLPIMLYLTSNGILGAYAIARRDALPVPNLVSAPRTTYAPLSTFAQAAIPRRPAARTSYISEAPPSAASTIAGPSNALTGSPSRPVPRASSPATRASSEAADPGPGLRAVGSQAASSSGQSLSDEDNVAETTITAAPASTATLRASTPDLVPIESTSRASTAPHGQRARECLIQVHRLETNPPHSAASGDYGADPILLVHSAPSSPAGSTRFSSSITIGSGVGTEAPRGGVTDASSSIQRAPISPRTDGSANRNSGPGLVFSAAEKAVLSSWLRSEEALGAKRREIGGLRAALAAERERAEQLEAALHVEQSKVWELEKVAKAACRSAGRLLDHAPLKRYAYADLAAATAGFAEANIIGTGGFGTVYKGVVDHIEVAVKVLSEHGQQGPAEFQREVEVHCRVRHPHVTMLLGTCLEPRACLVYDLMPNGSLDDRLNRAGGSAALTWQARARIAAEVAVVLLALHSARPAPIIHRDVKPANILLDRNLVSKLCDVGLAEIAPQLAPGANLRAASHVSSRGGSAVGTFAYMDPQYANEGEYGPASDVFAFGVVLLQLLTGKPPVGLRRVVSEAVSAGRLRTVLDAAAGSWPAEDAAALARLAIACTETARKDRPSLERQIVPVLTAMKARALAASEREGGPEVPHKFRCPISQVKV